MNIFKKKSNKANVQKIESNKHLCVDEASDIAKTIIGKLGYKSMVFPKGSNYDYVIKSYYDSFEHGLQDGFTPVLVPVDDKLAEYWDILNDGGYDVNQVINKSMDLPDGKNLLIKRFAEYMSDIVSDDDSMEEFIGSYNGHIELIKRFTAIEDVDKSRLLETILFEVPTKNPWELVAYIPFGGWNDCPNVEEMLAICKYWYEKYMAIPVTISHDVMEMSVPEPVAQSEVLELAKEHFAFTTDRVTQCTESGTLSEVAASLEVSKIWYFWWD